MKQYPVLVDKKHSVLFRRPVLSEETVTGMYEMKLVKERLYECDSVFIFSKVNVYPFLSKSECGLLCLSSC